MFASAAVSEIPESNQEQGKEEDNENGNLTYAIKLVIHPQCAIV